MSSFTDYTVVGGVTHNPLPISSTRDPTSQDKIAPGGEPYNVGRAWVNTTLLKNWQYAGSGNWTLLGSGATGSIISITGDSGGAEIPDGSGNFSILGTANQILVTGAANKETLSLVGPYTPATYTAHGVLLGEGTSSIVATAAGTNGQVLLGSTGADPAFGTITTSTGVAFTLGAASLAIDIAGGGFAVVDQTTSSRALLIQTMYVTDNGASLVTYTLPATAIQGSTIRIIGSSAGGWRIAQNANQAIKQGSQSTTTGTSGSLSSTNVNDCIEIVASVGGASTIWTVASFSGSFTFV